VRIDIVSIFPGYLEPLSLSLPGRAQRAGVLQIAVHDLRSWAHDLHRTVDDTPYGGGAGMVMTPGPWGEALDTLAPAGGPTQPRLLVPSPAGRPFSQADAARLAREPWLLFACGRYEGIDQRVLDDAATRMPVEEVSLGDYVVNGGEVAALVIVEAVARLLPGFLGNPASLLEESHGNGEGEALLEYPVYTKPASWRGHDVPAVLLAGDHARIADWRREQSLQRTADRRPDLLHPSRSVRLRGLDGEGASGQALVRQAVPADAGELWTLQRACWVQEAQANETLDIPPLVETLSDVQRWLSESQTYVVRVDGRLVGAVRGRLDGSRYRIGRLMVAPDVQGRGLGRWLLELAESRAPAEALEFELFTGVRSRDNLRLYRKAGYRVVSRSDDEGVITLTKPRG
jgi:tRNA (guanine37-N1)-methyltransferase